MLIDNHGRPVNYLRLAITDRCNLRCLYCMPEQGLQWLPRKELLTYEEIMKLLKVFSNLGITKLRFTGGEPFLRKDFMSLVENVFAEKLFSSISITTNGTLMLPHIPRLKALGIHSINLSLDTLDKDRFIQMTRRDDFDTVMQTLYTLLDHGINTKLNAIIMEGKNEEDIFSLVALTRDLPLDVRFIEEMPFNGKGLGSGIKWNFKTIIDEVKKQYPTLTKLTDERHSTSFNYHIPGHAGNVGVIAAYSRSFCGTCNRIRLTPRGTIKTCLYDEGGIDLKAMLRSGMSPVALSREILNAVHHRERNGFDVENQRRAHPVSESMATIGG